MKKILVLAVIGLIAGVGGGTGIAVVMRGGAALDSVAHDSTAVSHEPTTVSHDSTVIVAPHDSTASEHRTAKSEEQAHGEQAAPGGPKASAHAESTHVAPPPPRMEPATGAIEADSTQRTQVRRIGRIFAAMAPREAARVLQQLEDADVMVIVGSLNEKQAAAILQALPVERAAAISKGSLRSTAPRASRP